MLRISCFFAFCWASDLAYFFFCSSGTTLEPRTAAAAGREGTLHCPLTVENRHVSRLPTLHRVSINLLNNPVYCTRTSSTISDSVRPLATVVLCTTCRTPYLQ